MTVDLCRVIAVELLCTSMKQYVGARLKSSSQFHLRFHSITPWQASCRGHRAAKLLLRRPSGEKYFARISCLGQSVFAFLQQERICHTRVSSHFSNKSASVTLVPQCGQTQHLQAQLLTAPFQIRLPCSMGILGHPLLSSH